MDESFDTVYNEVKEMLKDKKVELSELTSILAPVMVLIEKVAADKSGSEKKELLIHVFKKIIDETDLSDEQKGYLNIACDTVIPPLVDAIIAASRGDLDLNISADCLKSCFGFLKNK